MKSLYVLVCESESGSGHDTELVEVFTSRERAARRAYAWVREHSSGVVSRNGNRWVGDPSRADDREAVEAAMHDSTGGPDVEMNTATIYSRRAS